MLHVKGIGPIELSRERGKLVCQGKIANLYQYMSIIYVNTKCQLIFQGKRTNSFINA